MSIRFNDLVKLKQREQEFLSLVENSSREDLAKCAKFLAMYLVLYRQQFGEIPAEGYIKLTESPGTDRESLEIVEHGIDEASEMLKMVIRQTLADETLYDTQPIH